MQEGSVRSVSKGSVVHDQTLFQKLESRASNLALKKCAVQTPVADRQVRPGAARPCRRELNEMRGANHKLQPKPKPMLDQ